MTFEEAVKQAVQHAKALDEQIEQYIQTTRFVNAINDFGGFEDMPAYETILKYALSKGLIKKLIVAGDNDMKTNQLVAQASHNGGFRDDLVTDVFNTLLNAVLKKVPQLIISTGNEMRQNRRSAKRRNRYIASIAAEVVFPSLPPADSSLRPIYDDLRAQGKPLHMLVQTE